MNQTYDRPPVEDVLLSFLMTGIIDVIVVSSSKVVDELHHIIGCVRMTFHRFLQVTCQRRATLTLRRAVSILQASVVRDAILTGNSIRRHKFEDIPWKTDLVGGNAIADPRPGVLLMLCVARAEARAHIQGSQGCLDPIGSEGIMLQETSTTLQAGILCEAVIGRVRRGDVVSVGCIHSCRHYCRKCLFDLFERFIVRSALVQEGRTIHHLNWCDDERPLREDDRADGLSIELRGCFQGVQKENFLLRWTSYCHLLVLLG